jgi:hypothetical protein
MRNTWIIFVILGAILSGCAPKFVVSDGPMDMGKPIEIMVRPHQSLGVQATEAVSRGKVTVFEAPLSDKILGEEYPGRIRWNGWAVNDDGKEFFCQFVRIGMYRTGEFMFAVVVDGKQQELRGLRVALLSSTGEFVSDFLGNMHRINRSEFLENKTYRREMIRENGSKVESRQEIPGFQNLVRSWNRYSISEGQMFSPYGEKDLKRIARINPSYGLLEKIIAKGNITISTNPVYSVASVALSIIEGMNAPSEGWDYASQLPSREVMAAIINYVGQFRLELIKQLNEEKVVAVQAVKAETVIATPTPVAPKVETPKVAKRQGKKNERRRP